MLERTFDFILYNIPTQHWFQRASSDQISPNILTSNWQCGEEAQSKPIPLCQHFPTHAPLEPWSSVEEAFARIERQPPSRLAVHCLFIVHCRLFSQRRKAWIYATMPPHLDRQMWTRLRHPRPDGPADDFKWFCSKLILLVRALSSHERPMQGRHWGQ